MKLSFETLKDKINGCWQGKNIGGILGAPFEAKRQINNVTFYTQDLTKGIPMNDDLDLQLVWLNAVEKYGRNVNASILGDYWLSYIVPDWSEYGIGKGNLREGIQPPLSGHMANNYKDSCGCFIRSEIWACLCAGHPEIAARYAYEDGIVDHASEGVYAEIFCATLQAAAFVESDKWKLIEIGLSYLPDECKVRLAVETVIDCYKSGKTWLEAREILFEIVPGYFALNGRPLKYITEEYNAEEMGMDAPNNIGIMVLGWLYGEDDFGKSLCIAVNCGEDTDCTAATLGAILGIIHGEKALPEKWVSPIGGVIEIGCLHKHSCLLWLPKDVYELSDRVMRNIPMFLGPDVCDIMCPDSVFEVETAKQFNYEGDLTYIPNSSGSGLPRLLSIKELLKLSPYCVYHNFSTFYAILDYIDEPYIKIGEPRKMRLIIGDNKSTPQTNWLNITIYTPDGTSIVQGKHFSLPLRNVYKSQTVLEFDVFAETINSAKTEIMIDIAQAGRHTYGAVKATLFASC